MTVCTYMLCHDGMSCRHGSYVMTCSYGMYDMTA
jgi:hypothetical protein